MTLKFVVGKDGFLFLDNDSNYVLSQTRGEIRLEEAFLDRIVTSHQLRVELCRSVGARYLHVVVPNKETVLCDLLPADVMYEQYGPTPLNQYIRYIEKRGCKEILPFFEPDVLKATENEVYSFYKGDTHWTYSAAFRYMHAAFSAKHWINECNLSDNLYIDELIEWYHGDLAQHAGLPPDEQKRLIFRNPSSEIVFEGEIVNEGYVRHYKSLKQKPMRSRALILHDSFTHWLFEYISEIFSEALFLHSPDLDVHFFRTYNPGVVIFIQAERFFIRKPSNELELRAWLRRQEDAKSVGRLTSDYISKFEGS